MKKKIIGLLLAFSMVIMIMPTIALAVDTPTGTWSDTVTAVPTGFTIDASTKTIGISSAEGLAWFGKQLNSNANYSGYTITISGKLDMSAHYWIPINAYGCGDLSGATIQGTNDAEIANLQINKAITQGNYNYYSGFIGQSAGVLNMKDIIFCGAAGVDNGSGISVVCGLTYGNLIFDNITVKDSTISGSTKTGAFVGFTGGDGYTVKLKNCKVENTTVKANYSFALMVGLANVNDTVVLENSVAVNSKTEWIPNNDDGFTEKGDISYNGGTYCIDGSETWLTDPNGAWVEGRTSKLLSVTDDDGQSRNVVGDWFIRPVAKIGTVEYPTLDAALTAATDGQTIKLLSDITLTDTAVISKSVTIDGAKDQGTYKITYTGSKDAIFYFEGNEKTFALKNCEIVNNATNATKYIYGGIDIKSQISGKVIVDKCNFNGGTATYGNLITHDSGDEDKVVVEFTNNIVNASHGSMMPYMRQGSKIVGNTFKDIGQNRVTSIVVNENNANDLIVITGNTFEGCTKNGLICVNYVEGITTNLQIKDNTYTNCTGNILRVESAATLTADSEIVNENGKNIIVVKDTNPNDFCDGVLTITGGTYSGVENTDKKAFFTEGKSVLIISGGTFAKAPDAAFIAEGYKVVESGDAFKVVPLDVVIDTPVVDGDNIKVGDKTITVTDENGAAVTDKEEAVAVIKNVLNNDAAADFDGTKIEEAIEIDGNAVQTLFSEVEEDITPEDVSLQVSVKLESATVSDTGANSKVTVITYDIKPVASVTLADGTVVTKEVPNDMIGDDIFFRLPVDANVDADYAAVYHEGDFIGNFEIEGEGTDKYITVSSSEFSLFRCEMLTDENVVATLDGVPYNSLEHLFADLKTGQSIVLNADTDEFSYTVNSAMEFSIADNGHENNIKITAGNGLTLEKNGNIYKITKNKMTIEKILEAMLAKDYGIFAFVLAILELIKEIFRGKTN